ncbi:DUF11 domain-containing protein, partial [Dokdonella sp.]|uniref:DUF11 domain-containing protein n=1 Tax=Dokdonella sp. TaxID=2291710 RepID=UPI001B21C2B8
TVGALANGANATLTLTATVTQSGAIVNTATRTGGDQLDPVSGNNAGSAGVNAGTLADLQLDKSVDEPAPNVGSNVTYTVRVRNAGPSPATSVNVTDALPAGLSFVSATASVGAYDDASGLWTVGDLAADAEVTLTIVATVTQAGEITNGATAAAAEADPDPSNNGDGVTINGQSADLQVVKTVDQAAPPVNGTVTYTVTVTNNGPSAATNVTAVDALPAGLSFVGATPSQGAYDEATGLWTIGDLASSGAGASATLTIVATVNPDQAGTTITNAAASAGGDQTDPNPANDEDRVEIVPQGQADVSVAKSGPPSATAGTNVTYAIVVGNAGPSTAAQVNLADPTPAGLVFVSADAPCATGFPCGLGDLAAGASVTVNVTYALPSDYAGADPIANTATVSSPTGDPDPSNNTGTATTPVLRSADLALTKTAPAMVTAGDTITYTIVVANAGPSDADGTTVSDPLPAGLTDVAVSCGGETGGAVCGVFDTSVSGTIATLPSGGSATLTITATAPDDATTLSNTATATPPSGTTDPDTTDNQDTADTDVVPVPRSANLSVTKTGPAEVAAGSEVAYTLRVANAGPDTAEAVVLDDPTPAGLTFISADAPCAAGFPCALGDLAAGASVELAARFALSPMASGTIVNTATVSSPTPDPDPNDDTSTVQTPIVVVVPETADLVVVKSGPASAPSGGTLAYRIVVTNRGPSDVPDAVLDDPTPDGLRFVSASAPCESGFPCALGALANGASATVTAVYDVRAEAGASIANTASANSPTVADPMPDNNASSVSTSVGPPPASPMPVPLDARWMLVLMGVLLSLGAAGTLRRR